MDMPASTSGAMDHSGMDMGGMDHGGMDHGGMDHGGMDMGMGSGGKQCKVSVSSDGLQRILSFLSVKTTTNTTNNTDALQHQHNRQLLPLRPMVH